MLNLPRPTVGNIIRLYKNENIILSKEKTGHPHVLSKRNCNFIIEAGQQDPFLSGPKVASDLCVNLDIPRSVNRQYAKL
jgi:hypothetical protein